MKDVLRRRLFSRLRTAQRDILCFIHFTIDFVFYLLQPTLIDDAFFDQQCAKTFHRIAFGITRAFSRQGDRASRRQRASVNRAGSPWRVQTPDLSLAAVIDGPSHSFQRPVGSVPSHLCRYSEGKFSTSLEMSPPAVCTNRDADRVAVVFQQKQHGQLQVAPY